MYKDCLTAALRTVASNGWQNQISVASTFNSIFSTNVSVANRYVKCISLNEYRLTADRSICTVDVNPFWAQKGRFPAECCHDMWCGKTRMVCLPDAEKFLKICLFVLTWSTNVTDGHTYRHVQTPHDDIGRACMIIVITTWMIVSTAVQATEFVGEYCVYAVFTRDIYSDIVIM